jgi:hypothetical protein
LCGRLKKFEDDREPDDSRLNGSESGSSSRDGVEPVRSAPGYKEFEFCRPP